MTGTCSYVGGYALRVEQASACPSDAAVDHGTGSQRQCCPSGTSPSTGREGTCCPVGIDCMGDVAAAPQCANKGWRLWTDGSSSEQAAWCCGPSSTGYVKNGNVGCTSMVNFRRKNLSSATPIAFASTACFAIPTETSTIKYASASSKSARSLPTVAVISHEQSDGGSESSGGGGGGGGGHHHATTVYIESYISVMPTASSSASSNGNNNMDQAAAVQGNGNGEGMMHNGMNSQAAKVGLGVGITIAILLLTLIALIVWIAWGRHRKGRGLFGPGGFSFRNLIRKPPQELDGEAIQHVPEEKKPAVLSTETTQSKWPGSPPPPPPITPVTPIARKPLPPITAEMLQPARPVFELPV